MNDMILMHKNEPCGILSIDDITGKFSGYTDNGNKLSPYLGNTDLKKMKIWWESRAIPGSRETIKKLINSLEVITPEDYLAKNLALSITDTYWIKPVDAEINYTDINLFGLRKYNEEKIPYHNATSYDPNASLGGQMEKYWDLSADYPVLVKESYKAEGQQAVNELFASKIHSIQNSSIAFTNYSISPMFNGGIESRCKAFTSPDIEFISAYEIISSQKFSNNLSMYDAYINICSANGLDREQMQDFMDYQTLTDFVISNTDEHLANFGVLRDANTMKLLGPAPIFDSGNSMFFSDLKKTPFTRAELLERKITSFYKTEEKMLKQVKNKKIVKSDLLPSPDNVADFYKENGIREDRAELIAKNYANKCVMLQEFQHGKIISLYNEKQSAAFSFQ